MWLGLPNVYRREITPTCLRDSEPKTRCARARELAWSAWNSAKIVQALGNHAWVGQNQNVPSLGLNVKYYLFVNPIWILTNLKEATSNKQRMLKKSFLLCVCPLGCISHKSIAVASRRARECAKREISKRVSRTTVNAPNKRASPFISGSRVI